MIDGADLVSLEANVRALINEDTAKFWTQANVFKAINDERLRLSRKIIGLNNGYMEQTYTTTPTDTVALPSNCYIVRNVELYWNSVWCQPRFIRDHARGQYQAQGTAVVYPAAVQFYQNSLVFEPNVGAATNLRIKYARLPSDMLTANLASGSATTAVLPSGTGSFIDDAYIDDQFLVTDGTGAGQISTVTDYVASTRTLTIASGATLDSTTVVSWLLPEPLTAWKDLVAMGAALRLLPRNRDDNRTQMLRGDYERDLEDMMNSLSQRQDEQAEHGNYNPHEDD